MKKKLFGYCLFGAPTGVTMYLFFTLFASWLRGDGQYYYTSGHLVLAYGNELNAVAAASAGAMVLGVIWATASLIYQETDWSLLKQTVVHCGVCVVPSLVIAYKMYWMPRNPEGLIQYLVLFSLLYAVNWVLQYLSMRKRVRQMNAMLHNLPGE